MIVEVTCRTVDGVHEWREGTRCLPAGALSAICWKIRTCIVCGHCESLEKLPNILIVEAPRHLPFWERLFSW